MRSRRRLSHAVFAQPYRRGRGCVCVGRVFCTAAPGPGKEPRRQGPALTLVEAAERGAGTPAGALPRRRRRSAAAGTAAGG